MNKSEVGFALVLSVTIDIYCRNWIISACAHGVNNRALCAYIGECSLYYVSNPSYIYGVTYISAWLQHHYSNN